jgi:predicted negative regulator of RcsB-dependent stress response
LDAYNPDDQLATLKTWWKQYGKALIAGVAIGALVLGGLNYWKLYKTRRAETASLLYEALLTDVQQGKADNISTTATKLVREYAATPYAGKAALLLARQQFDAKDPAGARQQLEWAIKNATETAVQHTARLRLGRLLLDQGDKDGALVLTNVKDMQGFVSAYDELRGDVLLAKGDRSGARAAYQAALDHLPPGSSYGPTLAMKRDDLGPGSN